MPTRAEVDATVERHAALVHSIANRAFGHVTGHDREDLLQAGFLGLVLAARRFDPSRGVAFSTFAVPTVWGTMLNHLEAEARGAMSGRRSGDDPALAADGSTSPVERAAAGERVAAVRSAVGALSPKLREAAEARLAGLVNARHAADAGVRASAVRGRMQLARASLRVSLAAFDPGDARPGG